MPYQKIKTASFTNFGGINTKTSPYLLGQNEFTNLVNIDFQMPGSLTKRWGSTMYVGTTLSTKIVGLYEFSQNQIGVTAGSSQIIAIGQSTAFFQTGFSLTPFYNFFGFTAFIAGQNKQAFINTIFAAGRTYIIGGTFWYDFENYSNFLWACNGQNIWKYNGTSTTFFSLPAPSPFFLSATFTIGSSGVVPSNGGMTGIYYYGAGYVNTNNYFGPGGVIQDLGSTTIPIGATFPDVVYAAGATSIEFTFALPPATSYGFDVGYGITGLAIYRAGPFSTFAPSNERTYTLISNQFIALGSTSFVDNNALAGATLIPTSLGMYSEIWSGVPMPDIFGNDSIFFHPKYMELYNNQMFFSGFASTNQGFAPGTSDTVNEADQFAIIPNKSTVFFSDIGVPESIQPENNFEVRTNDGDLVRGMKSYLSSLLLFKTNTFHRLSGQDPQNFSLVEMSDQYGCISNRAVCVAKNTCYFLDRKGVIAFNGANVEIISNKIDPIFARMNYQFALDQATMVYDKVRNEILIEIPIDGSVINNFTIVYDIIVQAWTTYEGINASSAAIVRGTLNNFSYLYGTNAGAIFDVGSSYLSDNGTAYTALIQTRFFNEIDPSTTKQWRRLFFNVDQVVGSTLQVDLLANYGSSVSVTRFFQQTPYLSRIDFGIPSTALSFTLTNFSATDTLRLHGFTVEYRFQRNVQDIET